MTDPPIRRIVVLGGAGDLMMRYLVPALAELAARGKLVDHIQLVGVGRDAMSTADYRGRVAEALRAAKPDPAFARRFEHVTADATNADSLRAAVADVATLVYAALPPAIFPRVLAALSEVGLSPGSRIAVEKPFGVDCTSARSLNDQIARTLPQFDVFRVDHFLGLPAVRNLIAARVDNDALDELLSAQAVARVEIIWDETLALEGRAGYYDGTGATRDMVQNHLLQVLSVVAMERPRDETAGALASCKSDVLRRTSLSPGKQSILLGQYGEGTSRGRHVPAYADEPGVQHAATTETFVELELSIAGDRWSGVPIVLRSGKALGTDRMEVAVVRRADNTRMVLGLNDQPGTTPGELAALVGGERDRLSAYACVLHAFLRGDGTLAVSGDEAEHGWRIVEPVLEAVRAGQPLHRYPAGSEGPSRRA